MDPTANPDPPARRPAVRTFDLAIAGALLAGWVALQGWVLPALGVRT